MKKLITALLNKNVNEKLKEYKEIEIVMNDIQYQEGIIEALEIHPDIEIIIISELLPGKYNIKELIEEIKNIKKEIKLIIILEKENKALENYLFAKGNINIFYNNEIEIKEIAELIINKNKKEELENEIKELKKIILNKEENKEKNIEKNEKKEIKNNEKINLITKEEKIEIETEIKKEYENNLLKNKIINSILKIIKKENKKTISKLIIISGCTGVGKTIFTVNIAKQLEKLNKKILIIDFDYINNSIQTLFGKNIKNKNVKNSENQKNNIQEETELNEEIIKINSKIDLISKINNIINNDIELIKIINNLKNKYDYILIDFEQEKNNNINYKSITNLVNNADKIIFMTEPNLLQIKKAKNLLEKYLNEWNINKEKIYILFNKIKSDTICFDILKEVFKNYNIIGKINFIKKCNTLINQNMNEIFLENKIKKQYKNIAKKIIRNNKLKKYYLEKIEN